jgi:hypothetical protein
MNHIGERAVKLLDRPDTFDNSKVQDLLRHEREMWDFSNYLMQNALDAGGELWWWSTPLMSGLAVIKDGRVTAAKWPGIS